MIKPTKKKTFDQTNNSNDNVDSLPPTFQNHPGDSIDEHSNIEAANIDLAVGEIGQQNENL